VEGNGLSGVAVATMMPSNSDAVVPARQSAFTAASLPMVDTVSSGRAKRRSRMPVRSTIHWSDVSSVFSKSALVTIRSGIETPSPAI